MIKYLYNHYQTMALKRTVLETYKSQRGRRYGKRHWLKTMASHVGHVGSGHNASGLCLDNGPTSWTKKSHCAASTVLNIHRDYWCRWHCQIIDQGHWSLSRAEKNTDSISWAGMHRWQHCFHLLLQLWQPITTWSLVQLCNQLQKNILLLLYSSTITRKHFVF